ncbi:MAG: sigma-70 family RNA polymerase sigma factor [Planctomycetes bacterium]|nr:sigma-70 family RNA polymerase sigma factor [Planctomycetota bacterium]
MVSKEQDPLSPEFATTRWSIVLAAGREGTPRAREALATLCQAYWYPLYAYVRRQGHNADEAQDLTQGFFAQFIEKNYFRALDPKKGKFRAYLLASMKHFLANEWDRAHAQKRGGRQVPISLDFEGAEGRYSREPAHDLTPERIFERRWALTLLDQVLARLRQDFLKSGKEERFERLKVFLTAGKKTVPYREVAAELGLSEGAVKVAIHRLRKRYRNHLRAEIAQTVSNPSEIDEEIRHLFSALG